MSEVEYGEVTQSTPLLVQFKGSGVGVPVRKVQGMTYTVGAMVAVTRTSPGDQGFALVLA